LNKARLRKKYLEVRKQFSQEELEASNVALRSRLFDELVHRQGLIHVFLPIMEKREVNTWPILHWLWDNGWHTCTSITHFDDNQLTHAQINTDTTFVENKWGVPEPINEQSVLPLEIDVVLVPMLCFDLTGHRVGYGKGYYDRFLSACRNDVLKIGLCQSEPIAQVSDASGLDITMDICITPQKIYKFG
jgi:5-formyltetrahydrofolate cyclo-ligase